MQGLMKIAAFTAPAMVLGLLLGYFLFTKTSADIDGDAIRQEMNYAFEQYSEFADTPDKKTYWKEQLENAKQRLAKAEIKQQKLEEESDKMHGDIKDGVDQINKEVNNSKQEKLNELKKALKN